MGKKTTLTFSILAILVTASHAETRKPGIVSFNVSRSPVTNAPAQPVTLYGCNNTVVNTHVSWNSENQVLGNVPYGNYTSDTGKPYYIAKYYIASPEVFRNAPGNQNPYLGLVIPDRFTFYGERPAQIIHLNYQLFNPTYLAEIPTDFNYMYDGKSCNSQKVNLIPINTQCKDLPWRNGALGGAGIGLLSNKPSSTAFLPMLKKNKDPLQCTTTILDDIILDFEVFFASKEGKTKSINLTELYKQSEPIKLICIPRAPTEVPAGCV
ncbi:MAG: hypothetical protein Q8R79_04770 [Legionellaceae bacterium]|nr:hypothetical protein [Legionellaceae bacterium]